MGQNYRPAAGSHTTPSPPSQNPDVSVTAGGPRVLGTAGDSQPVEPLGVPRIGYPNPGVGYPQEDVYPLMELGVVAGLLRVAMMLRPSSVSPSGLRRTS
jgi:hypothetical protein